MRFTCPFVAPVKERGMIKIEELLKLMAKENASDLIIKTGGCPAMRINGQVRFVGDEAVSGDTVKSFVENLIGPSEIKKFRETGAVDRAVAVEGVGRFRCNIFRQAGRLALVFRYVKRNIPSFKDLHLPVEPMKNLASLKRGLVLATGVAGSGKSTTLAAMVEFLNKNFAKHIITIEDPVEYLFEDRMSMVSQREIGTDSPSFAAALKQSLRQAPDVIMIGEMRDKDTMEAALQAAETGHLVFSTLHTVNAVQTVERIISLFPPHQHELLRMELALNLAGVVSLRLLRLKNGEGQMPAVEILTNTPTVREILLEGRTKELPKALAEGQYYGTMTFNQSLIRLYESGNIELEDALSASDNPDELKLQMRGITKGGVGIAG
ncbi:MAG TPA: PilT/PilU family type 4a pilus ATPase [Planctomycetes bacterium]|nr:PilT/PilU family type 4a pilus ATPase [Planctomycetota bacterium]